MTDDAPEKPSNVLTFRLPDGPVMKSFAEAMLPENLAQMSPKGRAFFVNNPDAARAAFFPEECDPLKPWLPKGEADGPDDKEPR